MNTNSSNPVILMPKSNKAQPLLAMNHYTHRVDFKGSWTSSGPRTGTPAFVHKYCDHSQDPLVDKSKDNGETVQRGATRQFPTKLYEMLIKASDDDSLDAFEDIVSWQPHGRCFIVRNPKKFVAYVMPT